MTAMVNSSVKKKMVAVAVAAKGAAIQDVEGTELLSYIASAAPSADNGMMAA